MLSYPGCKINIGLHIAGKREDGYHNIESIFLPLPLTDLLEIVRNDSPGAPPVLFSSSGLPIPGEDAENLCVKAVYLMKNEVPDLPPIRIHLHKVVPMGAGLGGGSANGAFTLKMLNQLFSLDIRPEKLAEMALELGSDCPFFLFNKPAYCTGRGEIIRPVPLSLTGYQLLLMNPGIHVPTGWAFRQLAAKMPGHSNVSYEELATGLAAPDQWNQLFINDFEALVFEAYPDIAQIKQQLRDAGALYAAMTGTGSTIYGIFPDASPISAIRLPGSAFSFSCRL